MTAPLDEVLVVAMEQAVAGPLSTARMAQAGARVIKVERHEGDNARGYDDVLEGESTYFTWLNQGKESVTVDIKTPEGVALVRSLLKAADVFVQNFAPGALDRAGLDYASLRKANPRLIRCDISAYGSDPANAHRRGYDLLVQAESGLIGASGAPGHPGRIGVSICDIGAGTAAYYGVLEALLQREKTGQGCRFEVSLFDVAADWMTVPYAHGAYGRGAPSPAGLAHPSIAPYGAFDTLDGDAILLAIQNEREWKRLCSDVLNNAEISSDARFSSNVDRVVHRAALDEAIAATISSLPSITVAQRLDRARIAWARVTPPGGLEGHTALRIKPYVTASSMAVELPAPPVDWPGRRSGVLARAPKRGEHNDAVVREFSAALASATSKGTAS